MFRIIVAELQCWKKKKKRDKICQQHIVSHSRVTR